MVRQRCRKIAAAPHLPERLFDVFFRGATVDTQGLIELSGIIMALAARLSGERNPLRVPCAALRCVLSRSPQHALLRRPQLRAATVTFSENRLAHHQQLHHGDLGLLPGDQACVISQVTKALLDAIAIEVTMTGLGFRGDSCNACFRRQNRRLLAQHLQQM